MVEMDCQIHHPHLLIHLQPLHQGQVECLHHLLPIFPIIIIAHRMVQVLGEVAEVLVVNPAIVILIMFQVIQRQTKEGSVGAPNLWSCINNGHQTQIKMFLSLLQQDIGTTEES